MDAQGRCTFANPAVERILGWKPEELIGQLLHAHIHGPHGERTPLPTGGPHEDDAQGDDLLLEGEDLWLSRGGVPVPVLRTCVPVQSGGRHVGAVLSFHDLRRHKEAQAARDRESEQTAFLSHASRMLASSLDYETTLGNVASVALPHLGAWCIVDLVEEDGSVRRLAVIHPETRMQELARQLEQGWPPERDDPLGAPLALRTRSTALITVHDELLMGVARSEDNLRILRELGIGSLMVVPLIARDHVLGAITFVSPASESAYAETDQALGEELAARITLAIDNARLYREARAAHARAEAATREAQAASRAKSQFLATTSHEIRTPINAIIGYTQLLEMGLYGQLAGPQREQLERIQASAQHLLALVNEVLDLAKVEAGQMTVRRERGSARQAIAAAQTLVYPRLAERRLEVVDGCGQGADAAYLGDPDRVRQVMINLLTNAAKFTPPGGRIEMRCGVADRADPQTRLSGGGPWTCMTVEDTGIGIPAEKLEAIFDPFVQVDQDLTRTGAGSGLGLAIGRQLARMMGGDLSVRSAPGRGSAFTLWLPAAAMADDAGESGLGRVAGEALAAAARRLLDRREPILDRYTTRLRAEPAVPGAEAASELMLQDHVVNFLSGVAQHLSAMAESEGTAVAMAHDTAVIQRTIAELHGVQRRRMDWGEAQLRLDWEILRDELERELREGIPKAELRDEVHGVVARMLEQAERASVRAWHHGAGDGG